MQVEIWDCARYILHACSVMMDISVIYLDKPIIIVQLGLLVTVILCRFSVAGFFFF